MRRTIRLLVVVLIGVLSWDGGVSSQAAVRVRVQTALGDIVVEVDQARAPITAANFLRYVDAGHYDGGNWHRTVKMDNQPESPVKIEVIDGKVELHCVLFASNTCALLASSSSTGEVWSSYP